MCVHLAHLGHDVVIDPEAKVARVFKQDGGGDPLAPRGISGRRLRATRCVLEVTPYAATLNPDVLQFYDSELTLVWCRWSNV